MAAFIHDDYTRAAMELVRSGRSFFITGKAGTGKTSLLKQIVHESRASGKNIAITAPTGIAAKNAEGQTLHSMFGLSTALYIPGKMRIRYRLDEHKEKVVKNLDILIIDEISMVRCDILDMVDLTLKHYKSSKKPFGGVQVVFFGDLFQLPPVVTEDDAELLYSHYDNQYFFSSDVIKNTPFPLLELNKVHRQEDPVFVKILNNIREGKYLLYDRQVLNKRLRPGFQPSEKESAVYLRTKNKKVYGHNMGKLDQLPGDSISFPAIIEDYFPKEQYPTEKNLKLKVGAKVMLLRNDNDGLKYVNGTQGVISSIYDEMIRVMTDEGELITVERSRWDLYHYLYDKESKTIVPYIVGSFIQYPIKLAWAVTIHKSQGMTFDKAIVDARQSFAPGQVYVALSRCRSLEGLILTSRISEDDIKVDPIVVEYMTNVEKINPFDIETTKDEEELFFFSEDGKSIVGCKSEVNGIIEIPDGVEKIADNAFENNTNITGLKCPNTLISIGEHAFYGCENLKEIDLNDALYEIGIEAFIGTALEKVDIPPYLYVIGLTPFECKMFVNRDNLLYSDINGVLYNENATSLILYPRSIHEDAIIVPESVLSIEQYAFENSRSKEIILPKDIEKLESNIFSGCQNLSTLTFNSITPEEIEIQNDTFKGFEIENCILCVPIEALSKYKKDNRFEDFKNISAIEGHRCLIYNDEGTEIIGYDESVCEPEIIIPEGVVAVKPKAFENNEIVENITFPSSLMMIGYSAFADCSKLIDIELANGIESIGYDAFNGTGLTYVSIPESVSKIGENAFTCEMDVEITNEKYWTTDGVLYSYDETKLVIYPSDFDNDIFEVPDTVNTICSFAFENSCLSKIILPDNLKDIEDEAFWGCNNLNSLDFPDTTEELGSNLFRYCTSLTKITIRVDDSEKLAVSEDSFEGFNKNKCELIVPHGCKENYDANPLFKGFLKITELPLEKVDNEHKEKKYSTGDYFNILPGINYSESKVFYKFESKGHCYVVLSSEGYFLKIINGGYYYLSDRISDCCYGSIWIHNKKEKETSYDVSYSLDNTTSKSFGHFIENYMERLLTYRDYKSGNSFTVDLKTGNKVI